MAIKHYAGNKITGLSTDTKPTNVPNGAMFTETDTRKEFVLDGGTWQAMSSTPNPTSGYLPYYNGTAFADSPLFTDGGGNIGAHTTSPAYGYHQYGGGYRLQAIADPAAPTITNVGTTGTTTYTYYVVAEDRNGNTTKVSAAGSTTTGNATLDATNYNTISWTAVSGAVKYYVLKTNTSTLLGTTTGTSLNDTGQATSAFTAPTRNATADAIVDGRVGVGTATPDVALHALGAIKAEGTGVNAAVSIKNTTATTGKTWTLFSKDNGNLGFFDGGAYRLEITNAGKLVIGSSDVYRDIDTASLALAGGTDSNVGGNLLLYGSTNATYPSHIRIRNGSTDALKIDNNANAVFGSSTIQTNTSRTTLTVDNASGGGEIDLALAGAKAIRFLTDGDHSLNIMADASNTKANSHIYFFVDNDEKMRINSSGQVGIGNTSPNMKLSVRHHDAGTADIQHAVRIDRTTSGTAAAGFGTGLMFLMAPAAYPTNPYGAAKIETAWIDPNHGTSLKSYLAFFTRNGNDWYEGLRINNSGTIKEGSKLARLTSSSTIAAGGGTKVFTIDFSASQNARAVIEVTVVGSSGDTGAVKKVFVVDVTSTVLNENYSANVYTVGSTAVTSYIDITVAHVGSGHDVTVTVKNTHASYAMQAGMCVEVLSQDGAEPANITAN